MRAALQPVFYRPPPSGGFSGPCIRQEESEKSEKYSLEIREREQKAHSSARLFTLQHNSPTFSVSFWGFFFRTLAAQNMSGSLHTNLSRCVTYSLLSSLFITQICCLLATFTQSPGLLLRGLKGFPLHLRGYLVPHGVGRWGGGVFCFYCSPLQQTEI